MVIKKLLELYVLVAQNTPRLHGKFPDPHGEVFEFKKAVYPDFSQIFLYSNCSFNCTICPAVDDITVLISKRLSLLLS